MTLRHLTLSLTIFTCTVTFGQTSTSDAIKVTTITKQVGPTTVLISQKKASGQTPGIPYCSVRILISQKSISRDSIILHAIEPVGGHHGVLVYDELVKGHLVISKYGDYDGRTIVINQQGKKFNTIGGYSFVDQNTGLLFSSFDSDLAGFSIFDLNTDKEILTISDLEVRPLEFYKAFKDRYFFRGIDDESQKISIWEIELDLERIMQVDINLTDLKGHELKPLTNYKDLKVTCQ